MINLILHCILSTKGDSNVGKTCLTLRASAGKFPVRTEATIGVDFKEKVVQVGSESIKVGRNLDNIFKLLNN